MRIILLLLLAALGINYQNIAQTPADALATAKTTHLYNNLKIIATQGFMLGHQDDQAYGVVGKLNQEDRMYWKPPAPTLRCTDGI